MSQKIEGTRVSIIVTKRQMDLINEISVRHGVTKSLAFRLMLDIGLDTYEAYRGFGIVRLAEFVKKMQRVVREKRQPRLI